MLQNTEQRGRIAAGIAFIVLGIMTFISNGRIDDSNGVLWMIVLAVISLICFWVFWTSHDLLLGVIAYVTGCIAALIFLTTVLNWNSVIVPVLVLIAIAAPFIYAWTLDKQRVARLFPPYVLLVIALGLLLIEVWNGSDQWLPPFVLTAIALPFMLAWLQDRKRWGMLIAAYVFIAIALSFFVMNDVIVSANLLPTYVLFVVGLPFVVAAAYTHKWQWVVPGAVLWLIGMFLASENFAGWQVLYTIIIPALMVLGGLMLLLRPPKHHDEPPPAKRGV